ncbi:MAG TPA: hypothetical protein VFH58_01710 [Acidimicrobiales bacterium]|nr:hypothetical protein [Acidimicrobiales bacterium]
MSYTAVVSQVTPTGFADLAQAAEELPQAEVTDGRVRLSIQGQAGIGLPGMVRLAGSLRTNSLVLPWVRVEVVISPWSAGRSEVAIHPITHLGRIDSLRSGRFFEAARSILPELIERLGAGLRVDVPAAPALAA